MVPEELKEMKAEEKISAMGDALGECEAEIYMCVEEKLCKGNESGSFTSRYSERARTWDGVESPSRQGSNVR